MSYVRLRGNDDQLNTLAENEQVAHGSYAGQESLDVLKDLETYGDSVSKGIFVDSKMLT
jgi:hypothetical protein